MINFLFEEACPEPAYKEHFTVPKNCAPYLAYFAYAHDIVYLLTPVFNNGLKPPCLAERPLSHLLSRVAEPIGLSR